MLDSGTKYKFLLDYARLRITSLSVWLIPSITWGNPESDTAVYMSVVMIGIT